LKDAAKHSRSESDPALSKLNARLADKQKELADLRASLRADSERKQPAEAKAETKTSRRADRDVRDLDRRMRDLERKLDRVLNRLEKDDEGAKKE
jgi:hypothetical protein